VATASTAAATAQARPSPSTSTAAATATTGAPRKLSRKTGLTIARFISCIAWTKVRSSVRARPGITPDDQV